MRAQAAHGTFRSTGHGNLYVVPDLEGNAAIGSSIIQHYGAGEIQIASVASLVQQTGPGNLYITSNKVLSGHISGSGNIYYDHGSADAVKAR